MSSIDAEELAGRRFPYQEDAALVEIKRMLERHLAYPVDYLPEQPAEFAGADD